MREAAPPCGYIREECYNDYVPKLKPRRSKPKIEAVAAMPTVETPTEAVVPPDDAADRITCRDILLAKLLTDILY